MYIYNSETVWSSENLPSVVRVIPGTIFGPGHLELSQSVSSWCFEVDRGEGSFPISSLDGVTLFWRLEHFDSMDTAGLWQLASEP